jgi:polysaccharide biosynthesis protein PslH
VTRILLISVEPPWPANHGGRIRTARIAETLGRHLDVTVAFPSDGLDVPDTKVRTAPLPWKPVSQMRTRISARPHLGGHHVLPIRDSLRAIEDEFRPHLVYWSHSYLAAWAGTMLRDVPQIVEFANIEGHRQRNLAESATGLRRLLRQVEAVKGTVWEPRVARKASLCVALTQQDMDLLRGWDSNVCLVPNGVELHPYLPSPESGYVLALASYDYEPNVQAARRIVRDVWPRVMERAPQARLVVGGRRSEALAAEFEATAGVSVIGTLPEVSDAYAGAAVTVAAASAGGGSQLKLTEAFSRGRSVVMSSFSASGLPQGLKDSGTYWVADTPGEFADTIVQALKELPSRHTREFDGWGRCQSLGWDKATEPLIDRIADLLRNSAGSGL